MPPRGRKAPIPVQQAPRLKAPGGFLANPPEYCQHVATYWPDPRNPDKTTRIADLVNCGYKCQQNKDCIPYQQVEQDRRYRRRQEDSDE